MGNLGEPTPLVMYSQVQPTRPSVLALEAGISPAHERSPGGGAKPQASLDLCLFQSVAVTVVGVLFCLFVGGLDTPLDPLWAEPIFVRLPNHLNSS